MTITFTVPADYPKEFPRSIDPSKPFSLSKLSLDKFFQEAQDSYVPYYSITVVESGNNQEKFYRVYDTSCFSRYIANNRESGEDPADPATKWPIQKIHYFAIQCFKFDEGDICKPIDLKNDSISISPLYLNDISKDIELMLLDSINANIIMDGSKKDAYQVRRTQYVISNLIKDGQLFSHLTDEQREQEVIQWLWCSSQGSYRSLLSLAKICLASSSIPQVQQKIAHLLSLKDPPERKENKKNYTEKNSKFEIEEMRYEMSKKIKMANQKKITLNGK